MVVAETGIRVQQALPSNCKEETQECNDRFVDQDCRKYCGGLSYKNGVCILSEGLIPPKAPEYRCCCS